ncbi:MAG TPA: nitrate reductase cytochrome c-type subunit; periplasmic nitrate reductase electron transfer subunit [Rhizobiales bacterium]|nr:periplasmic nitrate reductase, electron transfer subunit precursor [bacterium BMS3Bbin10]HDO51951.1 nitrate reductase cytochrome c-type subunit; periplasmic nitrate reductase electron transfer subunit [Hyphomicrobiales bacterium]
MQNSAWRLRRATGSIASPGNRAVMMEEVMKKFLLIVLSVAFMSVDAGVIARAEVATLRGANPLDAAAKQFDRRQQETIDGNFKRSWKQQPPTIPHKIEKDEINLQVNTCLRCHGAANYKKEKAPKVGDSHFIAADGTKSDKLDMRRYTCDQCHAPQQKVEPLIGNTFRTVKQ